MQQQSPLLLQQRTIISLCDFSGNWSKPYRDAGYNVVQVDLKHGNDVRMFQHYSTAQHSTAQHSTAQHSTAMCMAYWPPLPVQPSPAAGRNIGRKKTRTGARLRGWL